MYIEWINGPVFPPFLSPFFLLPFLSFFSYTFFPSSFLSTKLTLFLHSQTWPLMHYLSYSSQKLCEISIMIVPILQVWKQDQGDRQLAHPKGQTPYRVVFQCCCLCWKHFGSFSLEFPFGQSMNHIRKPVSFGHSQKGWFPVWSSQFMFVSK